MPDLDQIKQGKQEARDRRGWFPKGRSGNPAGRPRGCRDYVNRAARLLLAGAGETLTRKAVELALAGDPAALWLCLERIVGPYRERAVRISRSAACVISPTPNEQVEDLALAVDGAPQVHPLPAIRTPISSKCDRALGRGRPCLSLRAISGPNFSTQRRIVS